MKKFGRNSMLRWIALALILSAVILTVFELIVFSRLRTSFPSGTKIASMEVAGLNQEQAANRITQAYSIPLELRYGENIIQVKPSSLGFSLDLTAMMTAADQARVSQPFWPSFLGYLFNDQPPSQAVPLRASIDEGRIRDYLVNEIASRYDQEPVAFIPIPGTEGSTQGTSGKALDVERSMVLITAALKSPSARVVNLSVTPGVAARPTMTTLHILLQQIVDANDFNGEVEIYMQDLETGGDLQFAYGYGETLISDIAFQADSTIKIAIMITAYRLVNEPASTEVATLIQNMISHSDNIATDELMRVVMDQSYGPMEVTKTARALGLKNTFLDGMFYPGAPLLTGPIQTPANQRTDLNTDPDIYNQTTPTEIGLLLADIFQCAQNGGGTFAAVFPGEISQNECKSMITYLTQNRIGVLLEAGLPEGTQIGHKHGWALEILDGVIHTIGDAGLVFTPGGNYVVTIFIHSNNQIVWDSANLLYADLSRAIYNYFNYTS